VVVLEKFESGESIVSQPERLKVYKAGRPVAETERRMTLRAPPPA
jgi:hypothetical protein